MVINFSAYEMWHFLRYISKLVPVVTLIKCYFVKFNINFTIFKHLFPIFQYLKILFIFRERGKEGKKGEKLRCVLEKHLSVLTRHQLGTWPTTQACAVTVNRTNDLSVLTPALNLLSHSSQDPFSNIHTFL